MKKIVIIGGSAAGPKTAAKAKRMNPENIIELYTDDNIISYSACGLPYFIEGTVKSINQLIIRTPEDFEKQGIKVFLNHKAQKILPEKKCVIINDKEVSYDELVICTGAKPNIPNIKNIDMNGVYFLRRVSDGIKIKEAMQNAKRAIIVGGGYIGIELLEAFVHNGLSVSIVESRSRLMGIFDSEFSDLIKNFILERDGQWVDMHFNQEIVEFVADEDGKFAKLITKSGLEIEADFCIIASGVKPNVELAYDAGVKIGSKGGIVTDVAMKTNIEHIWAAGDCTEVKCMITKRPMYLSLGTIANKEGRVAAININTDPKIGERFEGVLGSAITKYFNYTIALTGMTQENAAKLGDKYNIQSISATVIKKDKAGYMPDSENITIKLVANKKTGKLLGAQGVGTGDVNKRINTVTAALQSGLTIDEFLHLDLAYAPPYSSTIDILLTAAYRLKSQMEDS